MDQPSLTELLDRFNGPRGWSQYHSPKNLAMALSAEAGELLAEFRWLTEQESYAASEDSSLRARVSSEIADVSIFLLLICDQLKIDITDAVRAKVAENESRFPPE